MNENLDQLSSFSFVAYALGYLLNELTATCWFNFLLLFMALSGYQQLGPVAMLSGQIADAVTAPLVAVLSDRTKSRWGQRRPWYLFGLILLIISFLLTFTKADSVPLFKSSPTLYYLLFPSLFNVGWACLQITHLALVPTLTLDLSRRDRLNTTRNYVSALGNFGMLLSGILVFKGLQGVDHQFFVMGCVAVSGGVLGSVVFMCSISQKRVAVSIIREEAQGQGQVASARDWLCKVQFYTYCLAYCGARVSSNFVNGLMAFFLIQLGLISKDQMRQNGISFIVAAVPLLGYLVSFLVNRFLPIALLKYGRRKVTIFGVFLVGLWSSMVWMDMCGRWWLLILGVVSINGGNSILVSCSTNMISDVVGRSGSKGGFVFGIYSFIEKVVNGVLLFEVGRSLHKQGFNLWPSMGLCPWISSLWVLGVVGLGKVEQYKKQEESELKNLL